MLADLTDAAGHQGLLKSVNRMSLVRHLCAHPGLSRADLATAVGLTKSTVSMLVRELIAEGWLAEREVVATHEPGRRPTPLVIDPHRLALLGAEVAVGSLRAVATSLDGEVRASVQATFDLRAPAADCIGALAAALQKLQRQADKTGQRVIGIGVGLPGGVDEAAGALRFAPNLGWRDVAFAEGLARRLAGGPLADVPLCVQNEADVAAIGEAEFNPAPGDDPLLYVSVNHGVGAGVIVGGRLLAGAHGFAGEVGHIVLQINGPLCSCGRRGCAEALVGLRAMQPPAPAAIRRAGRHLGVLLQNLAAAYDPARIVLGGAAVALGDDFVQPALRTLQAYADAARLPVPAVRLARFGADAVAVGAAGLARYRLTRPLIAPGAAARMRSAAS